MSVSGAVDRSRRKKAAVADRARRDALKDAIPDIQPPDRIKRMREDEEPAAEIDEDDD